MREERLINIPRFQKKSRGRYSYERVKVFDAMEKWTVDFYEA